MPELAGIMLAVVIQAQRLLQKIHATGSVEIDAQIANGEREDDDKETFVPDEPVTGGCAPCRVGRHVLMFGLWGWEETFSLPVGGPLDDYL